ncbi:hypothetical protein Rsub_10415 [Raphidocelis subcapitata]|uniref:V-type proton ATPase subunit e n=1 Tax=Raphidocelis subcapitata TaxID=307507 RepID=A0A2V0PEW0_9CHLO|nr:hypothetical protein Rsub_10415 [Raphidocelis subcapitata]|eukprot:GBF97492.1 hypothetical protein Rsub_10415 [Raphidocelis subcapitata]
MSYWIGTLCFVAVQIIVTLCINLFSKRSSKGLPHILAITSVVQCWFMWTIVYLAHKNPLVQPAGGH